ncbi:UDP-N-acetylmuramoylalanyl-D-glutamyl-2, 6-diaminopimelate--D-alanyl-D-alanine ligase, partial [Xanthomonas sp. Kuri4-1]
HAELAAALRADLAATTAAPLRVLVKGSRGSAMDKIVTALLARGEDAPHAA